MPTLTHTLFIIACLSALFVLLTLSWIVICMMQLRNTLAKYTEASEYHNRQLVDFNSALQHLGSKIQDLDSAARLQHERLCEYTQRTQAQLLQAQQSSLSNAMQDVRKQLEATLNTQNTTLSHLQSSITEQLNTLNGTVAQKLDTGLQKTNQLFSNMLERLTLIDQAQQVITNLSNEVVSLQDILNNKQARGHFGEVQLNQLIKNCLPQAHYGLQYSLPNGKRADCVLFLPEPTGNIAIDAKFPLENFRKMQKCSAQDATKATTQFVYNVKTHIKDIADRYVDINGSYKAALMFLPAETIFAHIHDLHPELVEFAYTHKVWLVSPTTLMAVLHTVQALLKDVQTQKQVHIIQKHLAALGQDFQRFQSRMHNVAKHISNANEQVGQVHISAEKIAKRFEKIEQCELPNDPLCLTQDIS